MDVATTHANTNHRNPVAGTSSMSLTPRRAPTMDATANTIAGVQDTSPAQTKIPKVTVPNARVTTNFNALPLTKS